MSSPDDLLQLGGKAFGSRLFLGSGKYRSADEMRRALVASGTEMVTVAIRRLELDGPKRRTLLDEIDLGRYRILPNTAGCKTPQDALLVARLARSLGLGDWVKLEVIDDARYLLPDPLGTLEATKLLVAEGFTVLPYMNADPALARRLEAAGAAAVMPLAAPIGSGQGMLSLQQIAIIIEEARVPVIVDAGLGTPSDAAQALELGADAVLVNTAIAEAQDPALMAAAFRAGVVAGRLAHRAGRMPKRPLARASSPLEGVVA